MLILHLTTKELSAIVRNAIHQTFSRQSPYTEDVFTFTLSASEAAGLVDIPEMELVKLAVCRKVPHVLESGEFYFNAIQLQHWLQMSKDCNELPNQ